MLKLAYFSAVLFLFLSCHNPPAVPTYDYLLSNDNDLIIPPSGAENNWLTIIGGNHTGQFYVSPNGNDQNPGSFDQPFRTIAYAVTRLAPGDTLVILARVPGNKPVIAGENNLLCAFDIANCRYLRIENLEITSANRARFREAIAGTAGPVEQVILKDLNIHHIDEFGIDIGDAHNLQIINCQITYCGFGAMGGPAGTQGGWRNVLIDNCDLSYSGHYYQGGDGSNRPYDRPDGFGIEASAGPIEIRNTTATHNYGDGLDSKAAHTYLHECLIANNSCDGVKLWGDSSRVENALIYGRGDGDATTTPWSPLVISTEKPNAHFALINCTVDDTVGENYLMHVQYDNPTIPVSLQIVNTIFSSRGNNAPVIWLADSVRYEVTNNLFYAPKDERLLIQGDTTYTAAAVGQIGTGNIYGNPQFIAVGWGNEGNYHLNAASPAIDAGATHLAPSIDLDKIPRPRGNGVDIGCYEQ